MSSGDPAGKRKQSASGRTRSAKAAPNQRPPSPLREAQKELARQKLIEAARVAFETKGYVDTTVDDIAQGAGASRGTFYIYFQGKNEILQALMQLMHTEVERIGLFEDFRTLQEPSVEALQEWFEKYVTYYLDHLHIWRAMHQAQVVEADFTDLVKAAIDMYADLWKSTGLDRNGSDSDLRIGATMLYTFVDQFMYLWLVQGQDLDRAATTRALATAVCGAVSPRR
jgi:AcrR family transcriptional regulator